MRFVVGFLIVAAIAAGILKHSRHEEAATPMVQVAKAEPTSVRPASEHNWPKSSLDRAADLKRQIAQQRKENSY